MKTTDEMNDEIRARVNAELPRPAGGFETFEAREAWLDAHEKRFKELCAESANADHAQRIRETNETKHTPGPWFYNRVSGYDYGSYQYSVSGICTNINKEADARLIAAAPELLAALEALLHGSRNVTSQADWQAEREEASAMARAAIAKARGGGRIDDPPQEPSPLIAPLEWALAQLEPSLDPEWQAAHAAALEALVKAKGGSR